MHDVLKHLRWTLKGFVALSMLSLSVPVAALETVPEPLSAPVQTLSPLCPSAQSSSETVTATAMPESATGQSFPACSLSSAPPRRVFRGLYDDACELYTDPLHWNAWQWAGLGGIVLVTAGLVQEDVNLDWRFQYKRPWLDTTMPYFTDAADAAYAIPGVGLLWLTGEVFDDETLAETSSSALEGMAFGGLTTVVIKYTFAADRPSTGATYHRFFDYGFSVGSPSFPSGHTIVAFDLAEVYGAQYGRWWTYPLACVVAYSRLYLGAHWPSDVIAGAAIGTLTGMATESMDQRKGYLRKWSFSMSPEGDSGAVMTASEHF